MHIAFDTEDLSTADQSVLRALLDSLAAPGAPAPKKAAKPAETPSEASETPSEPESSPEPDPALLDKAVKKALNLIRVQKKEDVVVAALTKLGHEKVTQLKTNADLEAFLAELP